MAAQRGDRPSATSLQAPVTLQHPHRPEAFRRDPGEDSDNPGTVAPSAPSQATRLISKGKMNEEKIFHFQIPPSLLHLEEYLRGLEGGAPCVLPEAPLGPPGGGTEAVLGGSGGPVTAVE